MVITIGPDLESTLNDLAHKQGVAPEVLALNALRERFLAATPLQGPMSGKNSYSGWRGIAGYLYRIGPLAGRRSTSNGLLDRHKHSGSPGEHR